MQNLSYAIAFASLIFALHLFGVRPVRRAPPFLLGVCFFVFATQAVLLSLLLENGIPHWAAIVRPAIAMTIGPLLFLYFTSASRLEFRIRYQLILHFIPAVFVAYELAASWYPIDIDFAIISSFGAYTVAVGLKLLDGPEQFRHLGEGANTAYRWLLAGTALLGVSFAGEIGIYVDIIHGSALSQSIPLLLMLVLNLIVAAFVLMAGLRRPSSLDWLYSFGASLTGRQGSTISQSECKICVQDFEQLVTSEGLHAQDGVTLGVAATRLGVPPRRLSEAINRIHGESYSRYMNRRRVSDAKRMLRAANEKPMIDIMFDSGFRTKSSFNKEFRAIEGMSPSEYRDTARLKPGN